MKKEKKYKIVLRAKKNMLIKNIFSWIQAINTTIKFVSNPICYVYSSYLAKITKKVKNYKRVN